jgi:cytochrome c peroxidase
VSSLPVARRIARLTIAGLLAVGTSLALTACALRTAEPAPTLPVADRSFFGAAPMNEQLRALDALGLPPGDARAALGRRLFFDQRLSPLVTTRPPASPTAARSRSASAAGAGSAMRPP